MSLVHLQQLNVKKSLKMMKIVNIDKENLHSLRSTRRTIMIFLGKMCFLILLKVTKKLRVFPLQGTSHLKSLLKSNIHIPTYAGFLSFNVTLILSIAIESLSKIFWDI